MMKSTKNVPGSIGMMFPLSECAGKAPLNTGLIAIVAIVVVVAGIFILSNNPLIPPSIPDDGAIPSQSETASTQLTPPAPPGTPDALKTELSKAKYLKEVFTIDRDRYDLFEKASVYRNETLDQTKQFFYDCCNLSNEEEIFSDIPPFPTDFAEVAYDLQVGRLYQIGVLGPEYYKQPEFYFNGLEPSITNQKFAFKPWSEPQLQYWGDYGFLTYPNRQFDTVSKSGRKSFTASVFTTNGWNIQNYVGVHLVTSSSDSKFFDIKVSEDKTGQPYFLLEPTFPKFYKEWATKVVIEGEVKPDTPLGIYVIGLNAVSPPKEINEKWGDEHKGLYAPYGFLAPSGNYIDLVIAVTE
jgi:hypothetical protein